LIPKTYDINDPGSKVRNHRGTTSPVISVNRPDRYISTISAMKRSK
jgi:hypothetical protein